MTVRPKTWKTAFKINKVFYIILWIMSLCVAFITGIFLLYGEFAFALPFLILWFYSIWCLRSIQKNIERCEMEIAYGNK